MKVDTTHCNLEAAPFNFVFYVMDYTGATA